MNDAYTLHTDYSENLREADKRQDGDKYLGEKISSIVTSLKDLTEKLQPVLEIESHKRYEQEFLGRYEVAEDKLLLLDVSHELDFLEESIEGFSKI